MDAYWPGRKDNYFDVQLTRYGTTAALLRIRGAIEFWLAVPTFVVTFPLAILGARKTLGFPVAALSGETKLAHLLMRPMKILSRSMLRTEKKQRQLTRVYNKKLLRYAVQEYAAEKNTKASVQQALRFSRKIVDLGFEPIEQINSLKDAVEEVYRLAYVADGGNSRRRTQRAVVHAARAAKSIGAPVPGWMRHVRERSAR